MSSEENEQFAQKTLKIEQLLQRLEQSKDGKRLTSGIMDKFETIKKRLENLESSEREMFNDEYGSKLHDAVVSLDEAIIGESIPEPEDYFIFSITFLVLIVFLFG